MNCFVNFRHIWSDHELKPQKTTATTVFSGVGGSWMSVNRLRAAQCRCCCCCPQMKRNPVSGGRFSVQRESGGPRALT